MQFTAEDFILCILHIALGIKIIYRYISNFWRHWRWFRLWGNGEVTGITATPSQGHTMDASASAISAPPCVTLTHWLSYWCFIWDTIEVHSQHTIVNTLRGLPCSLSPMSLSQHAGNISIKLPLKQSGGSQMFLQNRILMCSGTQQFTANLVLLLTSIIPHSNKVTDNSY